MYKNISIIFLILFFLTKSHAEIANKIVIEGNNRVSEDTIKLYGGLQENKNFSERDINRVLRDLYSTEFFENVEINLNNGVLNIKVKEFPVVRKIILEGEVKKAYREEIRKLISTKENKSFNKSNLLKDIDIIKKLYSSLGYNFANVDTKVKETENKNIDILFEINRGDRNKISSINFVGNKNIRSKRLRDVVASEESKFWKFLSRNTNLNENIINLDKRLLENYYKSIGFYDVKVSSNIGQINSSGDADLIYSIEEGTRYRIKKISTNVDSVFNKEIFFPLNEIFSDYVGNYYSPFKIKKLLDEIDKLIDNNNLQFVEHNVEEVIGKDTIDIIFNIFEGEKNLVERINITGNNTTNENVIRGELLVDEGDPLTKINLEKSISRIKGRGLFKDVTYNVKDSDQDNLKIIDINVEEQSTGEISAGAGVGTSGGTLAFGITENNWLGEGKALGADITIDEESIAGFIRYSDPNYDFLGNSLYYSLASEKNDKPNQGYENSVISASIGTGFEQYRNVMVSLGLSASYDDLQTQSNASASLKKQAGSFNEISGSYGFSLDKRDRVFMPTSGSITSFSQSIPFYADKKFIANNFSRSMYKSFNENVIGSAKVHLSAINGIGNEDVRLSKRRNLSEKKLRGFERGKVGPVDGNDHVGGNYAAAVNLETNLPNLIPDNYNADAIFFLDLANVWGVDYTSDIDESNELRSSTGISINWISPIGPLSFVFAQDLAKASTDVTQSFSFNLGTTF